MFYSDHAPPHFHLTTASMISPSSIRTVIYRAGRSARGSAVGHGRCRTSRSRCRGTANLWHTTILELPNLAIGGAPQCVRCTVGLGGFDEHGRSGVRDARACAFIRLVSPSRLKVASETRDVPDRRTPRQPSDRAARRPGTWILGEMDPDPGTYLGGRSRRVGEQSGCGPASTPNATIGTRRPGLQWRVSG